MKKLLSILSLALLLVGASSVSANATGDINCNGASYACSTNGDLVMQINNFYKWCACGSLVVFIDVCNDYETVTATYPCVPE